MADAATVYTRHPDRKTWLAARRKGIGGSDIPAIMGLSPFRTPLSVWNEKVGIADLDAEGESQKEAMWLRLGTKMEPVIAEMLEEEAGVRVERLPLTIATDPDHPELICSPDCFVHTGHEGQPPLLGELKTADSSKAEDWAEGVPQDYLIQVQHNLGVTRLPCAIMACVIGGTRDFRWMRVERDEALIQAIREAALAFWEMVKSETPPDPTGSKADADALLARFPRAAEGKVISLGADELDLTWELQKIKEEKDRLEERDVQIRNLIRARLGDAEVGILPGDYGKWTWKTQERKGYVVAPSVSRVLRSPTVKKDK